MDKKALRLIIALVLVVAALAVYWIWRTNVLNRVAEVPESESSTTETTEETQIQKTSFAVVVVHKDGTTKETTIETEKTYLGAALIEAGVVEAEENRFGMHIKTANGEKAVFPEDKAYWAVYVGENLADRATDLLPVEEGKTYKLVCTAPAPLTSADNAAEHLFYNVYQPLARGYIGTDWSAVSAFAEYMGYQAHTSEGVYSIKDLDNRHVWFGGSKTSLGGPSVITATYHVYVDSVDYVEAGVRGRVRNAKDPIYNLENPVYFIDQNIYTNLSAPVESMAEAEQYILDNGTLTQKTFILVVQNKLGKLHNSYLVATQDEFMGAALEHAGFIKVAEGSDGPYIEQVRGEKADTGCVWLLWEGDHYTSLPIDTTPVEENKTYTLAYKRIR